MCRAGDWLPVSPCGDRTIVRSFTASDPPRAVSGGGYPAEVFPHHADAILPGVVDVRAYQLRFAWTRSDVQLVPALRFSVF